MSTRPEPHGLADRPADVSTLLVQPGSADYESARRTSDPRHRDARPAAVAYPRSTAEVAAVVTEAARRGWRVTPRSGGHCFVGRSSAGDLVVDVSALDRIAVTGGQVEVGSGVRLGPLYRTLAAHRVTLPAGCGPAVGVAGLTLGGGLGLLGRRHGLTCDRLTAAEVVLADGRTVVCDDRHETDLFWALRGAGGGHFGIVTRFVFAPVPEPTVTVFRLEWPPDDAACLVEAWTGWAPEADDGLSAQLELTTPEDPRRPLGVRLVGTMVADPATTREAAADLGRRAGRAAETAAFTERRYAAAKAVLGDGPAADDRPLESHRSQLFAAPFAAASALRLVDHLVRSRRAGELRTLSLLPLGGAYARVPDAATAYAHRRSRFLVEHVAAVRPTAGRREQVEAARWSAESREILAPEASVGVYPNFPDADLADWATAYWGTNQARLRQVKRHYDPGNLFWARQGLHTDDERNPADG